jgi:hypothetical protein
MVPQVVHVLEAAGAAVEGVMVAGFCARAAAEQASVSANSVTAGACIMFAPRMIATNLEPSLR